MAEDRWPTPGDDESGWQWLLRVARYAWRRIRPRPPELTGADLVPEGAEPICPRCVLPHHPLAAICPHCGEIVTRWAVLMEPPWIFVWGLGLWRILERSRLSRLICVGLILTALDRLLAAGWLSYEEVELLAGRVTRPSAYWEGATYAWQIPICLLVAFRLVKKVVGVWGTWREGPEQEETPPAEVE